MTTIRVLGPDEADVLTNVAPDVFDHAVDPGWCAEFFTDPRHHLAVALDDERVVGMASAVHYVHPDKPPELWINEVGVAETHHGQGIGRRLLAALFDLGVTLGCSQAWVLTSPDNEAAKRMYLAAGGVTSDEPTVLFEFDLRDRRS
jgi:GNAT superfamily N-acetyltransferase